MQKAIYIGKLIIGVSPLVMILIGAIAQEGWIIGTGLVIAGAMALIGHKNDPDNKPVSY